MLAVRLHQFGDADMLNVEEAPAPEPRRGEVLVRVRGSSVNFADILARRGRDRRLGSRSLPLTPGYDVAGEVIGDYADGRFAPGTMVFGMCGPGAGAHAEVVSIPATQVALAPHIPLRQAGVVPRAALTALQGLRDHARAAMGARVLVVGAGGGTGAFAVQIARALGAQVTAACGAAQRDFVAALGAENVRDSAVPGFLTDGAPWDIIFDAAGRVRFRDARARLAPNGMLLAVRASPRGAALSGLRQVIRGIRYRLVIPRSSAADLATLAAWLDAGVLRAPVHLNFALTEIREAHRFYESGAANGKLSLTI